MPPAGRIADEIIRRVLEGRRTWAVVGASPDPARDSHRIARMLQSRGYRVIPVNPACDELLGVRCHPTLAAAVAAEGPIEVVDIFRRASEAGRHVDEADRGGGSRGLDAARRDRPRSGRARPRCGARRGDGPLPGDRDAAARDRRTVRLTPVHLTRGWAVSEHRPPII